jgi:tRNA A37 methylthiotransferase MiaB
MPGQIAPQEKSERHARLAELEAELRSKYFTSLIGRALTVLVEGASDTSPGSLLGTSCRYAPVEIAAEIASGSLVRVTAERLDSYGTKIVGVPTTTRGAGA